MEDIELEQRKIHKLLGKGKLFPFKNQQKLG